MKYTAGFLALSLLVAPVRADENSWFPWEWFQFQISWRTRSEAPRQAEPRHDNNRGQARKSVIKNGAVI